MPNVFDSIYINMVRAGESSGKLDIEKDNIGRGLARYNGSLGETNYPQMVLGLWGTKYRFISN